MPKTWYLNKGKHALSIAMYYNYLNFHGIVENKNLGTFNEKIAKEYGRIACIEVYQEEDLKLYNGQWYSFYHHSSFSHYDKKLCLDRINKKIKTSSEFLRKANFLFLSFGTARIYEFKETGQVVSNCHKLPSKYFKYRLLSPVEIFSENLS